MGAWVEKAFENDSALDWLAELENRGIAGLRDTLSSIVEMDEPDVDEGSAAIAAAEVVAAALGCGRDRLTRAGIAWLEQNPGAVVEDDSVLARDAVEHVMAEGSELASLWAEGGASNAWLEHVRELRLRLETIASQAKARPRNAGPSKSPSTIGVREKQTILTFLGARGLEPTAAQLARIQRSTDPTEIRGWLARVVNAPSVAAMLDG